MFVTLQAFGKTYCGLFLIMLLTEKSPRFALVGLSCLGPAYGNSESRVPTDVAVL